MNKSWRGGGVDDGCIPVEVAILDLSCRLAGKMAAVGEVTTLELAGSRLSQRVWVSEVHVDVDKSRGSGRADQAWTGERLNKVRRNRRGDAAVDRWVRRSEG